MLKNILTLKIFFLFWLSLSSAWGEYARIDKITSSQKLTAITDCQKMEVAQRVVILNQDDQSILGYAEIDKINKSSSLLNSLELRIIRHSRDALIRVGDYVDACASDEKVQQAVGSAELLSSYGFNNSAKFKFLPYQGLIIGSTAETLKKNEYLIEFLGDFYYGLTDRWTLNTQLAGDLLGTSNLLVKYKYLDGFQNMMTFGTAINYYDRLNQYSGEFSVYWDSINSSNQITHTVLSLKSPLGTDDSKSFKIFSSSSLQSGYEFILPNWNRILVGPRYYFALQTVGGYFGYMWIWDTLHFSINMHTINISNFNIDGNKGYFFVFDTFWRF